MSTHENLYSILTELLETKTDISYYLFFIIIIYIIDNDNSINENFKVELLYIIYFILHFFAYMLTKLYLQDDYINILYNRYKEIYQDIENKTKETLNLLKHSFTKYSYIIWCSH